MNNEKREQQMMDAADRYADEVCDEFCTGAQVADTINDFCAGWRAADSHPHWIPVEEELPKIPKNDWKSDNVLFVVNGDIFYGYHGKYTWHTPFLSFNNHDVTHWMPLPQAPRKEE